LKEIPPEQIKLFDKPWVGAFPFFLLSSMLPYFVFQPYTIVSAKFG